MADRAPPQVQTPVVGPARPRLWEVQGLTPSYAGWVRVDDDEDDYYGESYFQDVCEMALLALGGQRLLEDAVDVAAGHVDEHFPWDGYGDEPAPRVAAYIAVLRERVVIARAALPARRPGDPPDQPWSCI